MKVSARRGQFPIFLGFLLASAILENSTLLAHLNGPMDMVDLVILAGVALRGPKQIQDFMNAGRAARILVTCLIMALIWMLVAVGVQGASEGGARDALHAARATLILVLFAPVGKHMGHMRLLAAMMVGFAFVFSLGGILKWAGIPLPGLDRTTGSTVAGLSFGSVFGYDGVAPYSILVLAGLGGVLYLGRHLHRGLLLGVGAVIGAGAVVSGSRSTWLSVAGFLLTFMLLTLTRRIPDKTERGVATSLAALVSIIGLAAASKYISNTLVSLRPETALAREQGLQTLAQELFDNTRSMLLGPGRRSFMDSTGGVAPHNLLAELSTSGGIIAPLVLMGGLGVLLAELYVISRRAPMDLAGRAAAAMVMGVGIESLFSPTLGLSILWVVVAFAVAITVSHDDIPHAAAPSNRAARLIEHDHVPLRNQLDGAIEERPWPNTGPTSPVIGMGGWIQHPARLNELKNAGGSAGGN